MYQNIYYERQKNLMHLWDDKNGYQTMPYRKYAYKKDPHGQHLSMNGEKLTRISKWEKDEADDLFQSGKRMKLMTYLKVMFQKQQEY